jgi:CheY-like chemotaxis protein
MNDSLIFAEEPEKVDSAPLKNWKVLIIDDEPEIHQVTRLVVSDFVFAGKGLELVSAYSAQEAKEILTNEGEDAFALAIVDVVMETNNAGLELVQWVRQELNNHNIRLVLRTGQPGEAPEENVIRDYDLNDYKNKTELTALKLKTLFYSALRGYRDILIIE